MFFIQTHFKPRANYSYNQPSFDIQKVFEGENDPSNNVGKTLDLIVGFKKEHPQDFNELFEILKELIQEYEQNPDEIKQNLKEIIKLR
ncbi:hypothetical protein HpKG91_09910 [Helicobacter pylori]